MLIIFSPEAIDDELPELPTAPIRTIPVVEESARFVLSFDEFID